jgi:hypothetical protein
LVIPEAFRDIGLCSIGWRCLLCGEIVDGVILRNRVAPSMTSLMDEEPSETEQESSADEYKLGAVT